MVLLDTLGFKDGIAAYKWMLIHYCPGIQLRNGFSLSANYFSEKLSYGRYGKKKHSCHLVVIKKPKNPLLPEKLIDIVLSAPTHSKLNEKIKNVLVANNCLETGKTKIAKFQKLLMES